MGPLPHFGEQMYRILFPQAPIVQTRRHRAYQMDNYPQVTLLLTSLST
jgi:hypothetical protein